jgi:predicted DNA-binding transcriptional regulator AlpA
MSKPKGIVESILVTAEEAADLMRVGPATWRRWHYGAKCPEPVRMGKCVRWRREELVEWARAGCPGRDDWRRLRR